MSLIKTLSAAAVTVALAVPAMAADVTMTNSENSQVRIKCDSTNCKVKQKNAGGSWKTVENKPGGNSNFKKLKTKYKEAGFQ